MTPKDVPTNPGNRSTGRHLAAGLVGGLYAALLLSLIDWWLMLRQGSRGGDIESVAALCYAFLLLGSTGATAGACFALGVVVWKRLFHRSHAGLARKFVRTGRGAFLLCFVLGGGLLIVLGWMPHWRRTGISPPWSTGLGVAFLLALLVLGIARRLALRRWGGVSSRARDRMTTSSLIILALLLAGAVAGWGRAGERRDRPGSRWTAPQIAAVNRADSGGREVPAGSPPVVLLLLDTLRWDALSCYGNGDLLTPHLDRFCRESLQFEVARAQASWTKPSIATLLTSTHPSRHGARGRADRISPAVPSLAGLFRRAGYRTGAVVANGNLSPAFGFSRGFDHYRYLRPRIALGAGGRALGLGSYRIASAVRQRAARGRRDHRHFKRDAAEVNVAVLNWLVGLTSEERRGFFLFVNYVDPHDPYFHHPYDGRALGAVDGKSPSPRVRDEMAALYDGEVAFLDHHLGRLFAHLRRLGLYQESLIVITSDHGEEFLDHGGWWHGLTLFEEQVRVPLLVRLPGGAAGGRRATGEAGLIDVAPGLLELAGLGHRTPEAMTGQSMARLMPGGDTAGEPAPRLFYADETLDGNILASLTEGRWKYVRANLDNPRGLPREALYDVAEDPGEEVNLAGRHPELAAAMSARLDRLHTPGGGEAKTLPPAALDEETAEHLRALGYLH